MSLKTITSKISGVRAIDVLGRNQAMRLMLAKASGEKIKYSIRTVR